MRTEILRFEKKMKGLERKVFKKRNSFLLIATSGMSFFWRREVGKEFMSFLKMRLSIYNHLLAAQRQLKLR